MRRDRAPQTASHTLVKETLVIPATFFAPAIDRGADFITHSAGRALLGGLWSLTSRCIVCLGLECLGLLVIHGLRLLDHRLLWDRCLR